MQTLIVAAHRIVFDRHSWQVFFGELVACYHAFAAGTASTAVPYPLRRFRPLAAAAPRKPDRLERDAS